MRWIKKSLRLRIVPNFGEQSELGWVLRIWEEQGQAKTKTGGLVGWASGCHAGGRKFDSGRTNTKGLNWLESAAFVITSANG